MYLKIQFETNVVYNKCVKVFCKDTPFTSHTYTCFPLCFWKSCSIMDDTTFSLIFSCVKKALMYFFFYLNLSKRICCSLFFQRNFKILHFFEPLGFNKELSGYFGRYWHSFFFCHGFDVFVMCEIAGICWELLGNEKLRVTIILIVKVFYAWNWFMPSNVLWEIIGNLSIELFFLSQ